MEITCKAEIDTITILINGIEHIILPRGRIGLQAWKVNDKKFVFEIESQTVDNGVVMTYKNEFHYNSHEKWAKVIKLISENK